MSTKSIWVSCRRNSSIDQNLHQILDSLIKPGSSRTEGGRRLHKVFLASLDLIPASDVLRAGRLLFFHSFSHCTSSFLNPAIWDKDNRNMSVGKLKGKVSCQLWYILLNFPNFYFKPIWALRVIIPVHNMCTPDGNLRMHAGAEDTCNAFITAYLEFKDHFKEHFRFILSS